MIVKNGCPMAMVRAMRAMPDAFPDMQLEDAGLLGLTAGLPPAWLQHCPDRACEREKFCCHFPKSSCFCNGKRHICLGVQVSSQTKANGMEGMGDEELATAVVNLLLFITIPN